KRRESDEPRHSIRPVRLGGTLTLDEHSVGERTLAGQSPDPLGGIGIADPDPAMPVTDREGRTFRQPRNGRELLQPRQVDCRKDGSLDRSRIVKKGMADVDRGPARGTVDLIVVALEVSLLQRTPKECAAREVRRA